MEARIIEREVPVKSYEERQAEWIKKNNVKVGTKVRVVRENTEDSWNPSAKRGTNAYRVEKFSIKKIYSNHLDLGEDWLFPYSMLEVIPEPSFKPFTLEIDVTSEDQLKDLYHRFYLSTKKVNSSSHSTGVSKAVYEHYSEVFGLIKRKTIELDL